MRKKLSVGGAITLAIMLATVTFIMTMIYAQKTFDSRVYNIRERETMYSKLAEVDQLVRRDAYTDIDEAAISEGMVRGYLSGLGDTNAKYLTAAEYSESLGATEGKNVGIGASFTQDASGYLRITEVMADSPAALNELAVGDLIVKIGDLAVTAENYEEAAAAVAGEAGTTVELTVHHESIERIVTLTRRRVETPTVAYRTVGEGNAIGYLRISDFTANTYNEFASALTSLLNSSVSGLVLDVRTLAKDDADSIDAMLSVADRLVGSGTMLSAAYRDGTTRVLGASNDVQLNLPIGILIDEKTSGAAELLAQILRDFGKAKIVGATSAGHCAMTETVTLADGSAVRITTALYVPPVSGSFEGVGVKPDFEVAFSGESAETVFALDELTDPQLKKAIEAAGGTVRQEIGSDLVATENETEGTPESDGDNGELEVVAEENGADDEDAETAAD